MSDFGQSSSVSPESHPRRGLKIAAGIAVVLVIGGGAFAATVAFTGGSPSSAPTTTAPTTTVPGRSGPFGGDRGRGVRPQAVGSVQSVGTTSFVLKEGTGTSVTVDVAQSTAYSSTTASAAFSDVKVGGEVAAYGTLSGSTLDATRVVLFASGASPGRGFGGGGFGGGGFGTVGTVKSVSSHSFVITTFSGSSATVTVTTATRYSERGGNSASYADVKAGERVAIAGSGTSTIAATAITILPAGGFGGGGFNGGESSAS